MPNVRHLCRVNREREWRKRKARALCQGPRRIAVKPVTTLLSSSFKLRIRPLILLLIPLIINYWIYVCILCFWECESIFSSQAAVISPRAVERLLRLPLEKKPMDSKRGRGVDGADTPQLLCTGVMSIAKPLLGRPEMYATNFLILSFIPMLVLCHILIPLRGWWSMSREEDHQGLFKEDACT